MCLTCRSFSARPLCAPCLSRLAPTGDRLVGDRIVVRSAWRHDGTGRALVHRLKYEGQLGAADQLAAAMAPLVGLATGLVPIPRTILRRHEFGVDPARELAQRLARLTGVEVFHVLRAAPMAPIHAGRSRDERAAPRLRVVRPPPSGVVLVDDVVTTGITLATAARVLGGSARAAVTATSAPDFASSPRPGTSKNMT